MDPEAVTKSIANLEKVVRACGAEFVGNIDHVRFRAGEDWFAMVGANQLFKLSKDGRQSVGTCIQNSIGPPWEVTASVILLLRHDPSLFDVWRAQAYGG
jgi:hypothetical protein